MEIDTLTESYERKLRHLELLLERAETYLMAHLSNAAGDSTYVEDALRIVVDARKYLA